MTFSSPSAYRSEYLSIYEIVLRLPSEIPEVKRLFNVPPSKVIYVYIYIKVLLFFCLDLTYTHRVPKSLPFLLQILIVILTTSLAY